MTLQAMADEMGCDLSAGEGYETYKYKPEIWDRTLVHVAALASKSETVQFLAWCACDLNKKSKSLKGATPLHIAASYGAGDAYQRLLDLGADPNILDDNGKTAADIRSS